VAADNPHPQDLSAQRLLVTEKVAPKISVIIPTFRRPEGLKRAITSVVGQTGLKALNIELIVCDNSPEGSARKVVRPFADSAPFRVIYVHEPDPGVANARNAAVVVARGEYIAFLDDDEEAPKGWLKGLTAIQKEFSADVVFGPVKARLDGKDVRYARYLGRFFSRSGPAHSGIIRGYYGCGNSLIRRKCLNRGLPPFAVERNQIGGEDDELFAKLKQEGRVFAWAADAFVYEDVPPARARLGYTLKRAFAFGQGPSYTAFKQGKPHEALGWMAQGAFQAAGFGLWGGVLSVFKSPDSAEALDKAARGVGKVLWFPPFKLGFYGRALLKAGA
jgi:succinoglycan biosynthesis protein ExoM